MLSVLEIGAIASGVSSVLLGLKGILKNRQLHKEIMHGTPEQHEARRGLELARRPLVNTRRMSIGRRGDAGPE